MDLVAGLKHNEVRRSHLHLNGVLSEYVSLWLTHAQSFTAASESRQKRRMLSCCVRAGGAGRCPAGVCSDLDSAFTCGALAPRDRPSTCWTLKQGSDSEPQVMLVNNCFLKIQKVEFKSQDACLTGDTWILESMMFYFKFDYKETFNSNRNQNWHDLVVLWSYCEGLFRAHYYSMKMCHGHLSLKCWKKLCSGYTENTFTIQSIQFWWIQLSSFILFNILFYITLHKDNWFQTVVHFNLNEWMN